MWTLFLLDTRKPVRMTRPGVKYTGHTESLLRGETNVKEQDRPLCNELIRMLLKQIQKLQSLSKSGLFQGV